jgi:hypothetical protein
MTAEDVYHSIKDKAYPYIELKTVEKHLKHLGQNGLLGELDMPDGSRSFMRLPDGTDQSGIPHGAKFRNQKDIDEQAWMKGKGSAIDFPLLLNWLSEDPSAVSRVTRVELLVKEIRVQISRDEPEAAEASFLRMLGLLEDEHPIIQIELLAAAARDLANCDVSRSLTLLDKAEVIAEEIQPPSRFWQLIHDVRSFVPEIGGYALARLEPQSLEGSLTVGTQCKLVVGLSTTKEGKLLEMHPWPDSNPLTVDVEVRATNMAVGVMAKPRVLYFPEHGSYPFRFTLYLEEAGLQSIDVDFYLSGHWLAHVGLRIEVVGETDEAFQDAEPPNQPALISGAEERSSVEATQAAVACSDLKEPVLSAFPAHTPQDYPVQLLIRIQECKGGFDIALGTDGDWLESERVGMKPRDLANRCSALQRKLSALWPSFELGPTHADKAMRALAKEGFLTFKMIFGDRVQTLVESALSTEAATIVIVSEDFFLPWEALYPKRPSDNFSAEDFWGMKYKITRVLPRRAAAHYIHPAIPVESCPCFGLIADNRLEHVGSRQRRHLIDLRDSEKLRLKELDELSTDSKDLGMRTLEGFLKNDLHIVEFACHAQFVPEDPILSYFVVSDRFPVRIKDMISEGIAFENRPLVILNACNTSVSDPLSIHSFASRLLQIGARGVIATECAVPDKFAAEFSVQLYKRLLQACSVGESLLEIRKYFLLEQDNPCALLYSMYASPQIRLDYSGGNNEQ